MVREGLPEVAASKLSLSLEERAMWQRGEVFLAEEAASAKAPGLQEAGARGQERSCGGGGGGGRQGPSGSQGTQTDPRGTKPLQCSAESEGIKTGRQEMGGGGG